MLFAINYSTQAVVLINQERLKADYLKCPDWPELIAEAELTRPAAVHFTLNAGRGKLKSKKLDLMDEIADRTHTPFINLHLEVRSSDLPNLPLETDEFRHRQFIFGRMIKDVEIAVKRFGNKRVIVENVPFRRVGHVLQPCVDPDIISRIVYETGCGLLLDIPHARISALTLGIDEREYMQRLPIQRLTELHFTGVLNLDGWLQDHLPAQQADWEALDWVLSKIQAREWAKPWMLAFEYGGVGGKFSWKSSAQTIEQQGSRLYQLVSKI